jgi:hypothetical protein
VKCNEVVENLKGIKTKREVKWFIGNEVSLSVVQCSKSADEQCVLCTVITRMLLDHIRIIVHMDISFIILLYIPVSFCALCL